jgi:hypothetical protein
MTDNGTVPPAHVWVQLYYKGEAKPVGEAGPIKIQPIPADVNDVQMGVKASYPARLAHCDVAELQVYEPGTAVPVPTEKVAASSWKVVPAGSTGPSPLIVVAPKPQQQNGKLRCCFRIHFYFSVLVFLYSMLLRIRICYFCVGKKASRSFDWTLFCW